MNIIVIGTFVDLCMYIFKSLYFGVCYNSSERFENWKQGLKAKIKGMTSPYIYPLWSLSSAATDTWKLTIGKEEKQNRNIFRKYGQEFS